MFQQSDMYYFNNAELEVLEANEGTLSRSKTIKINSFIQSFVSEIEKLASEDVAAAPPKVQTTKKKKPPSSQSGFAVIKAVQMELKTTAAPTTALRLRSSCLTPWVRPYRGIGKGIGSGRLKH
jgi:hypothetical protein